MSVTVRIPTPLRTATGGQSTAEVDGGTAGEVVRALAEVHPGIAERLFDGDGKVRRFINVFVDDEDIRFLQGLDTPVPQGGTVSIIPAVAGG
jgi:sulfur-carrier protein